ncbi:MAG TPA: hydantoinase B/oxoprolinase family protein, partial [Ktedonobacterales bacterium]
MSTRPVVDAITLEIFRSALTAIAEEMGVALTRSSYSPNIKERRDFSCALFDASGRMIAQA